MPSKNTRTATLDYKLSKSPEDDSSTVLRHSAQEQTAATYHHWPLAGKTLSTHIQELVMAVTLTSPVSYSQPCWDLFRTSVYPTVVVGLAQKKRKLSLRESRQIALGVMAETARRLC